MSMLSDYIRHVVDPMEASYRATVESQRRRIAALEAEVARAIEVVKPFADACQMLDDGISIAIADLGGSILADDGHFRRAAAYVTDNQGEA